MEKKFPPGGPAVPKEVVAPATIPGVEFVRPEEVGWVHLYDRTWCKPDGTEHTFPPGTNTTFPRFVDLPGMVRMMPPTKE